MRVILVLLMTVICLTTCAEAGKKGKKGKFQGCFKTLASCVDGADSKAIRVCANEMETCAVGDADGDAKKDPKKILKRMPPPIRAIVKEYSTCKGAAKDDDTHAKCVLSYMAKMANMQEKMMKMMRRKKGGN